NADLRLTEKGYELGLVNEARWTAFNEKRKLIEAETARLKTTWLHPSKVDQDVVKSVLGDDLKREHNLYDLLVRPNISYAALMALDEAKQAVTHPQVIEQLEIQARYGGYIERQREEVAKQAKMEDKGLPEQLDYTNVRGLSNEAKQKLGDQRPATIGQASRIPGITPATISLLLVHLKKHAA
ncbi:MAG: tRNA uridine-5-carboxymethylaminomethyl(34) synthesis enzyme MnmG, partial [Arenicellales bacterium]